MLKLIFDNFSFIPKMTSPNVDFCGSNNFNGKCSKKINVLFTISGVIASFWRVFIKFRWHGQKLTQGGPASEPNEGQTIAIIGDSGGWASQSANSLKIVGDLMLGAIWLCNLQILWYYYFSHAVCLLLKTVQVNLVVIYYYCVY